MSLLNLVRTGTMTRLPYGGCTVAFLALLLLATKLFPVGGVSLLMPPIWMLMIAAPRLRDIGWSPWWALSIFAPHFLVGFVSAAFHFDPEGEIRTALNGTATLALFGIFVLFGVIKSGRARPDATPAAVK